MPSMANPQSSRSSARPAICVEAFTYKEQARKSQAHLTGSENPRRRADIPGKGQVTHRSHLLLTLPTTLSPSFPSKVLNVSGITYPRREVSICARQPVECGLPGTDPLQQRTDTPDEVSDSSAIRPASPILILPPSQNWDQESISWSSAMASTPCTTSDIEASRTS